ncbi:MAG: DMT family transporter [Spirochaetia bacterium]
MILSSEKRRGLLADGAILFAAMCWGGDYIVVKDALTRISPLYLNGFRFLFAFLLMVLIFWKKFAHIQKIEILGGLISGLSMFVGFAFLTVGMQYTDAGKAAFITASYVVMVPFILWIAYKIFPGKKSFLSTTICFIGIALIVFDPGGEFPFNLRDLLILISALGFAVNIVAIDYYVKRADPYNITIIETLTAGTLSMIGGFILEPAPAAFSTETVFSFLYIVLLGTLGTHMLANIAMKYTIATRASIMFNMEAVFAVVFAIIFLGDTLTPQMTAGFALVFVSVLITEIEFKKMFKNKNRIITS